MIATNENSTKSDVQTESVLGSFEKKKKSDEEKVTGILGLHLQGARAVVEKRSEIIDAIATETSLDEGPTKGRSAILSISLHLVSFSKDNPTVATFLFAQ